MLLRTARYTLCKHSSDTAATSDMAEPGYGKATVMSYVCVIIYRTQKGKCFKMSYIQCRSFHCLNWYFPEIIWNPEIGLTNDHIGLYLIFAS